MRALKRSEGLSERTLSKRSKKKRQRLKRSAPPTVPPSTPPPPIDPNIRVHFEAMWNDSWSCRRCMHAHQTLLEAAKCAMPHGCGWYVIAVENDKPRELNEAENEAVNRFRFGNQKPSRFNRP